MQITTGTAVAVGTQNNHSRHPSFGSLVSTIKRGDVEAANGAFTALQELAPESANLKRNASLDGIEVALKTGDIETVRTALKAFQQGHESVNEAPIAPADRPLRPGSTIEILV